ncbi:MAG: tripartite tricarboxylate transporter TctB family protein [Gammaproteobacteria bacterium]|nr:tripartite tricarboxylate transporter TctB family protein [Gammaproteobacteria bacterium]
MTRINRDIIAYLVIIGFCILMLTWGIPTYTPAYPGYGASPALVPIVSISVMLFMACLSMFRCCVAVFMNRPLPIEESKFPEELNEEGGFTQVGRVKLYHLVSIMIPCVLLVVAIEYIAYIFVSFVFLMIFQYVIGSRKWGQSIVVSVSLTAVLYIVMRYGFGVPVPGPQIF